MTISRKKALQQLRNLPDEEIDYSDIPEVGDDFWERAEIIEPQGKQLTSLRIDADVLTWFKMKGRGYQTLMNVVLRSYMEHQKQREGD